MRVDLSNEELEVIEECLRLHVATLDESKANGPPDRLKITDIVSKLKVARQGPAGRTG